MRKEYELPKRKTGKFKLKMTFAILALTALSIAEVYLMMNYQMEYLYLGAVGLVILCFVYWIVDISFRMQTEDDTVHEKEYENLYKAEKVSYISMKQSFLDIENILKGMEDLPVDDVIQSQKAIGKVTIQRNKESMQAVIDAQKELKERMDALEDKLNEFHGISERHQEILNSIQNLEVSVKESLSGAIAPGSVLQDNQGTQEKNFVEEAAEQIASEEPPVEGELLSQEQPEEEAKEEPKTAEEAPGAMMTEEQIAELLSSQEQPEEEAKEEPKTGEEAPGAMMTEEQIAELLSSQESSTTETPVEEKPAVSEESLEEKAAMPDLSDPGHVMTPEEIAALLENM